MQVVKELPLLSETPMLKREVSLVTVFNKILAADCLVTFPIIGSLSSEAPTMLHNV